MPPIDAPRYSLTELAGLAGVTPRTVRFYMSQGLLPSPGSSGPGAKYTDAHLARLRLIRKLQREHLPLADILQRLTGLDDTEIASLAEAPEAPSDPEDSALDYIRRVLGPGSPPAPTMPAQARMLATALAPPPAIAPLFAAPAPARSPDQRLERSNWERIPLAPDIELHVRRPLPRPLAKQVDRLVSIARDLLEEEPS